MRTRTTESLPFVIFVSAALLATGCKGLKPMPDFIQVTRDATVELPEIEKVPQRLSSTVDNVGTISPKPGDAPGRNEQVKDRLAAQAEKIRLRREQLAKANQQGATDAVTSEAKQSTADAVSVSLNDALVESAPKSKSEPKQETQVSRPMSDTAIGVTLSDLVVEELPDSSQDGVSQIEKAAKSEQSGSVAVQMPVLDLEQDKAPVDVPDVQDATPVDESRVSAKRFTVPPLGAENVDPEPTLGSLIADPKQRPESIPVLELPSVPAEPAQQAASQEKSKGSPASGLVAQALAVEPVQDSAVLDLPMPPLEIDAPVAGKDDSKVVPASLEMPVPKTSEESAGNQAEAAKNPLGTHPAFVSNQDLYDVLMTRLAVANDGESEAERHRRLIMLQYVNVLAGKSTNAQSKLEGLSDSERKYLELQLSGLRKVIDPNGHPVIGRRLQAALPEIREANKYLAAATDELEIRSLSFCTEIEAFGQFKTFVGNRFQRGQQVILYCEIENFVARETEQGFQTHLKGSYEIYDADSEKVMSQKLPADVQVTSAFIRDYFIAYQMNLPSKLPAGTYRLQLTMENVHGKKYGQASIPLEIADKP